MPKYTHIFIAQSLYMALKEGRLSHSNCNVALNIKVEIRLQVCDRRQFQVK